MRYASPIYENDMVEATDVITASGTAVTIDTNYMKEIENSEGVKEPVQTTLVTVDFGGLFRNN